MCKGYHPGCDPDWLRGLGLMQTAREEEEKMQRLTDTDALIDEAATAISATRTVDDLERRLGVLRDREGVATDRLATFIVTMPEGLTPDEQAVFKQEISKSLEVIVKDAVAQVDYFKMWGHTDNA